MSIAAGSLQNEWAPFLVEPIFAARVWGFRDLHPWFDRVADTEPIGEVWLSGDDCVVATGVHAGRRLGDLFRLAPVSMLGPGAPSPDSPLLIKVIFAREKLSVQVHPDDALAQKYGSPRGKTECWYALAAETGAQVAVGIKAGVTHGQIEEGIRSGTLEQSLNLIGVSAGDVIFVDAGTVHAIWPGSILLEAQQNADITYRLYDYGRPRELHVEKGLEATKLATRAGKVAPRTLADRTILIDADYFRIEKIPVDHSTAFNQPIGDASPLEADSTAGLAYLFAAAGTGRITGAGFAPLDLPPRAIACVPDAAPEYAIENLGGLELIRLSPKWPESAHAAQSE
jgi:mannose-6-phosphate isomerase